MTQAVTAQQQGNFLFDVPGGADRSYGIEVAKLAGLPGSVVNRAKDILSELEQQGEKAPLPSAIREEAQLPLTALAEAEVLEQLRRLQPDVLTPIEAMSVLFDIVNKAKSI